MHCVIFEGIYWTKFAPLSLGRPLFNLVTGRSTLLEKQIRHLAPSRLSLWVRPELAEYCVNHLAPKLSVPTTVNQPLDDEPALLLSGRTLMLRDFVYPKDPCVVCDDQQWVRKALVKMPGLSPADAMGRTDQWMKIFDLPRVEPQARVVEALWDLIVWNEESLIADFAAMRGAPSPVPNGPWHVVNGEEIYLGKGVTLGPGCVLDADKGPIFIGEGATIGANAVVEGPCSVGSHCLVKPLSHLRQNTSIGPFSKVGGEISASILLGHTNKQHEGFLGTSYVGKWVNLGAGTTTSNMKNTLGEIEVETGHRKRSSGRRFLGSVIGDHTKTGIGTRLVAGAYVGFCSQIAEAGITPKFVPSYTFRTDDGNQKYELSKAIEVTRRVFARQHRGWTEGDERLMQYVAQVAPGVEGASPG